MTTAPDALVAATVIGAGTLSDGGVVSAGAVTVTKNVVCDWFNELSLAMHVTVVLPTANTLPDDGVHVTGRLPST